MHGRKVMSLYWKYIESHKNFLVKKIWIDLTDQKSCDINSIKHRGKLW